MPKNALYAQSGGVTPVINASAFGVIHAARQHRDRIGTVYAAENGVLGILNERLIDTAQLSDAQLALLKNAPGGAFGSCRHKLKHGAELKRLFEVFAAHDIGYLFYNGGGDSADTCLKVAEYAQYQGLELTAVHVPKTIDNDLPLTDNSPGFGSVAKYVATSIREAGLDVASMASSSTKVFILEVMGRHTGWIAAAAGLASDRDGAPPHLILTPEVPFEAGRFLKAVQETVARVGYCAIVASEGLRDTHGVFLSDAGSTDAFGHAQLGGVAPLLANLIKTELHHKCHWAVADYLQRAARHIASATDLAQAIAVGEAAVHYALAGIKSVMPAIVREDSEPYRWRLEPVPLLDVANREKPLPLEYLTSDGMHLSAAGRDYFLPLLQGEAPPPYLDGLPAYPSWQFELVSPRLTGFNAV
ncbi:pyrophosphate-dependent phosphofructokinase [Andreprevotia lacus DSM 23236]|jgi:6-phosphofructokinase 1|uniref:Pyrophosphate--fructose 6-phosphate 1-phosphotransferase n=1 Tax=Andreprevotia lacus DSM 23236 TaxID=1121001 RepID=A0A1W1XZ57_9NEIS|nr:6-phosphofructokinase [Andreprevotia lacus]SMC28788.1 pyrophosphate-dependent phosphofructokinase [Andreprevotia lacus DSM 23236]